MRYHILDSGQQRGHARPGASHGMTEETKAFGRFDNGFTLTFENGLVLSTRFGPGNDCDNREGTFISQTASESVRSLFSDPVEVGVWSNNDEAAVPPRDRDWVNGWQEVVFDVTDPYNDVRGYVNLAEWLQILDWCKEWKR